MHVILFGILLFGISALLSEILIWLRWRQLWSPHESLKDAKEFYLDNDKLKIGENYLSREMLHPYLGYVLNPAADEATWRASGFVKQPVNSFGILARDNELPRRSPGKVSIGVFGGSVAQYLAFDYAGELQAALQQTGIFADQEIVIHCLALGGFKQPQQLAQLAYFNALGAEFDLVINLDGFNEVALHPAENALKGICHTFPRAWASRAAARVDPAQIFLFGQLAVTQQSRAALWNFLSHPFVRLFPQIYYCTRLYESSLRSRKSRIVKSIRQFRPPVDLNLNASLQPTGSDAAQLVELWSRCSTLMHDLCRATSTRYFHFLQPNQYVAGSKPLTETELTSAFDPNHPYRPGVVAGYPLLRSAGSKLRDRGINFTDLTLLFADCHETAYSDRCCHFNALGNKMIAGAIATAIAASIANATNVDHEGVSAAYAD